MWPSGDLEQYLIFDRTKMLIQFEQAMENISGHLL